MIGDECIYGGGGQLPQFTFYPSPSLLEKIWVHEVSNTEEMVI